MGVGGWVLHLWRRAKDGEEMEEELEVQVT